MRCPFYMDSRWSVMEHPTMQCKFSVLQCRFSYVKIVPSQTYIYIYIYKDGHLKLSQSSQVPTISFTNMFLLAGQCQAMDHRRMEDQQEHQGHTRDTPGWIAWVSFLYLFSIFYFPFISFLCTNVCLYYFQSFAFMRSRGGLLLQKQWRMDQGRMRRPTDRSPGNNGGTTKVNMHETFVSTMYDLHLLALRFFHLANSIISQEHF